MKSGVYLNSFDASGISKCESPVGAGLMSLGLSRVIKANERDWKASIYGL